MTRRLVRFLSSLAFLAGAVMLGLALAEWALLTLPPLVLWGATLVAVGSVVAVQVGER